MAIDDIRDWDQIAAASAAIFHRVKEIHESGTPATIKTWDLAKVALDAARAVRLREANSRALKAGECRYTVDGVKYIVGTSGGGEYI